MISSHYRRLQSQYDAKIKIITRLLQKNQTIVIRPHPACIGDKKKFIKELGRVARLQDNEERTPFKLELISSNLNRIELYSLFSTAACYWKLIFADDMLSGKIIKVHFLYPLVLKYLDPDNHPVDQKLLLKFINKLSTKYPGIFVSNEPTNL